MEGLTIIPPEGYEVDKEKSIPFERIEFKEIPKKESIKTWKEIMKSKNIDEKESNPRAIQSMISGAKGE